MLCRGQHAEFSWGLGLHSVSVHGFQNVLGGFLHLSDSFANIAFGRLALIFSLLVLTKKPFSLFVRCLELGRGSGEFFQFAGENL